MATDLIECIWHGPDGELADRSIIRAGDRIRVPRHQAEGDARLEIVRPAKTPPVAAAKETS